MAKADRPNETTNTAAGINTPAEREDRAATDPLADAVAGIVDNIQAAFAGEPDDRKKRP